VEKTPSSDTIETMASKSKKRDPEQYKRFVETAKKAGADETEEGADRAFKKVTSKRTKEPRG
jgi:hypothetical protein